MKVMLNKWFVLAVLAALVLGAFALAAYGKAERFCTETQAAPRTAGSLLWDGLPGQLTSISIP